MNTSLPTIKTSIFLLSLLLISNSAFAQSNSERVIIKDSVVVEQTTPYLKKLIREASWQFIKTGETIDTQQVIATYQIQEINGYRFPVLIQKQLQVSGVEEGDSFTATLFFNTESYPQKTIPKLVLDNRTMGLESVTEISIFADNYWLAVHNQALLSCGYFYSHTLSIYNGKEWTTLETPQEDWSNPSFQGLNGMPSRL
jgi:hypothetical protein